MLTKERGEPLSLSTPHARLTTRTVPYAGTPYPPVRNTKAPSTQIHRNHGHTKHASKQPRIQTTSGHRHAATEILRITAHHPAPCPHVTRPRTLTLQRARDSEIWQLVRRAIEEMERGCERALGTVCEMRAKSVGKKTGCRVQSNGEETLRYFSSSMLHTWYIRVLMVSATSNQGLGKFFSFVGACARSAQWFGHNCCQGSDSLVVRAQRCQCQWSVPSILTYSAPPLPKGGRNRRSGGT